MAGDVTPTIPLYGTGRENTVHADRLITAASGLGTAPLLQSETIADLERRIAGTCQRTHAIAVNSCTDALTITLVALGIGAGDEVLVSDFTFVASAEAIVRAGARPVFVDVDEHGLMDLSAAAAACGPRTAAVVLVDLFGAMHDPCSVAEFADRHGLTVVEDAAQALGARYAGRSAGSVGVASCLSFDPTKHLSAPGSGGMIVTNDPALAERARRLRYHGRDQDGRYAEVGYNSQMSTFTAAMLLLKLDDLHRWQRARAGIASRYLDTLDDAARVVCGSRDPALTHAWQKFVIACDERDKVAAHLADWGVQTKPLYTPALHTHPAYASPTGAEARFPQSAGLADTCLALPIHAFLTDPEVSRVIDAVIHVLAG